MIVNLSGPLNAALVNSQSDHESLPERHPQASPSRLTAVLRSSGFTNVSREAYDSQLPQHRSGFYRVTLGMSGTICGPPLSHRA